MRLERMFLGAANQRAGLNRKIKANKEKMAQEVSQFTKDQLKEYIAKDEDQLQVLDFRLKFIQNCFNSEYRLFLEFTGIVNVMYKMWARKMMSDHFEIYKLWKEADSVIENWKFDVL